MTATIATTGFRTSLFPKDGTYLLPLKAAVRRALGVAPGDRVHATVSVEGFAATEAAYDG